MHSEPVDFATSQQDDSWDEEEGEEDEEEEEELSDDEERHALWDPSQATPARGLKGRRHAARAAAGTAGSGSEGHQPGPHRRRRSSTSTLLLPEEQPVLNHLNEQLSKAGKDPVPRPTVRRGRRLGGGWAHASTRRRLRAARKPPI